jgi:hypothetical protein
MRVARGWWLTLDEVIVVPGVIMSGVVSVRAKWGLDCVGDSHSALNRMSGTLGMLIYEKDIMVKTRLRATSSSAVLGMLPSSRGRGTYTVGLP